VYIDGAPASRFIKRGEDRINCQAAGLNIEIS
jgi:hypothetical protein